MKIATHNSITGEKPSFWSVLLNPFAKCQNKTLVEQYNQGCRMFDIRVIKKRNEYYGAHGWWRTKRPLKDYLWQLSVVTTERVYISITYEGVFKNYNSRLECISYYDDLINTFSNLHFIFGSLYAKHAELGISSAWGVLKQGVVLPENKQAFIPLDGRSWHTYIPIPRLWNKLYSEPHEFNNDYYKYVDFL